MRSLTKELLVVLSIAMTLVFYYLLANANRYRNDDVESGDQGAYLNYATKMLDSHYQAMGPRDRMPVYPFLLSRIHEPGMSRDAFFEKGKHFNIVLSILVLLCIYGIARTFFPPLHAFAFYLTSAFGLYIFKAGYVQAEVLFYLVAFIVFVLYLRWLVRPSWWISVSAGVATAVAHLTKASILPALMLFLACGIAKLLWDLVGHPREPRATVLRQAGKRLAMLSIVPALFLTITSPYLLNSKRAFGRYFYNVNSSIYIWADSFAAAKAGPGQHRDRYRWPDMPANQIPSASKYWREHTFAQAGQRIAYGVRQTGANLFGFKKYRVFLSVFFASAITVVAWRWQEALRIARYQPFAVLFVAGFFFGYFLLFTWYAAISKSARFALTLFLPWIFVCSLPLTTFGESIRFSRKNHEFNALVAFDIVVIVLAAHRLLRIASGYFPHI